MRLTLKALEAVRASYWFLPSVMAFLALALGAAMVWIDAVVAEDLLDGISWYQSVQPDGAHQVLSTIAGSMITVAGVVFSITIVAIGHAASQYGPRLLTNFMSDRGTQVTLGTFIATFVYCLVVLRTIRGGDDDFVPQLAVVVGIGLALCSIGVLIFYIHHVPRSIHINSVVDNIGRQLIKGMADRFPAFIGDPPDPDDAVTDDSRAPEQAVEEGRDTVAIVSHATGYIQGIADDRLMSTAHAHGLLVRLRYRPGDFVHCGRVLAHAWPAEKVSDHVAGALRTSFTVGSRRTPTGDLAFLVDELVEIGARALSTGVNDPYTLMIALDWMGAGASELARHRMPDPRRVDKDGTVRVIALPETFADFVDRGIGRLRPYVARDVNAALHMLVVLDEVLASCRTPEQYGALRHAAEALDEAAGNALDGNDRARVAAEAERFTRKLDRRAG